VAVIICSVNFRGRRLSTNLDLELFLKNKSMNRPSLCQRNAEQVRNSNFRTGTLGGLFVVPFVVDEVGKCQKILVKRWLYSGTLHRVA
jgi:hypothetical protein